jgi:hypothetical protein
VGAAEALGGSAQDGFSRADWIFANVAVPHAEDRPTLRAQSIVALTVTLRFRVLPTVNFNDQVRPSASEIEGVWSNGKLARELGAEARQQPPHLPLLGGRI